MDTNQNNNPYTNYVYTPETQPVTDPSRMTYGQQMQAEQKQAGNNKTEENASPYFGTTNGQPEKTEEQSQQGYFTASPYYETADGMPTIETKPDPHAGEHLEVHGFSSVFGGFQTASYVPDSPKAAPTGNPTYGAQTGTYGQNPIYGGQQGYPNPLYAQNATNVGQAPDQYRSRSIASMALGIASVTCSSSFYLSFLGLPLGIAALVLSGSYTNAANRHNGFSRAGKITGMIGTIMGALLALILVFFIWAMVDSSTW